ncbi:MAG: hypothetical protein EBZ13_10080 [Planctomycetia bacterium]|nr:hypothetical protein [Planctomycetia bacterium]
MTREVREVAKPRAIQHHGRLRAFKDAEAAYRCGQFIAGYVLGDTSAREWCERNDVYTRAMGGAQATKGDAFVDNVLSETLIRNVEEKNEVYNEMQRFPMTSDTLLVTRSSCRSGRRDSPAHGWLKTPRLAPRTPPLDR